jgi:hypothetical protein
LPREDVDVVIAQIRGDPEPQIAYQRVLLPEEIPQRRPFIQTEVDATQLSGPIPARCSAVSRSALNGMPVFATAPARLRLPSTSATFFSK